MRAEKSTIFATAVDFSHRFFAKRTILIFSQQLLQGFSTNFHLFPTAFPQFSPWFSTDFFVKKQGIFDFFHLFLKLSTIDIKVVHTFCG